MNIFDHILSSRTLIMLKRKLSLIIVAALMVNISATSLNAFAETINSNEIVESTTQESKQAEIYV